jgi:hypothetical protein
MPPAVIGGGSAWVALVLWNVRTNSTGSTIVDDFFMPPSPRPVILGAHGRATLTQKAT